MATSFPYFLDGMLELMRTFLPQVDARFNDTNIIGSIVDDDETILANYERQLMSANCEAEETDGEGGGNPAGAQVKFPFAALIRKPPRSIPGASNYSAATFNRKITLVRDARKATDGGTGAGYTTEGSADVEVDFQLAIFDNDYDKLTEFLALWMLKSGHMATRFKYTVPLTDPDLFELVANLVLQEGEQTVKASLSERKEFGIVYKQLFPLLARTPLVLAQAIPVKIILDPKHSFILDKPFPSETT